MKKSFILISVIAFCTSLFAETISYGDSVRVIKSSPEYRTVTTRTPYQECWDEQVPVN